jgi:glycosyltransferase involved in cell wall biosynthesis
LGKQPLPILNYTTPSMRQALAAQLRKRHFDFVQIEGTPMAAYVPDIQRQSQPPQIVYDWHNIESELMQRYALGDASRPRRLYASQTVWRLQQVEGDMLARGAAHLVCSTREQSQLSVIAPQAGIHVISNGVDTESFSPPPSSISGETVRDRLLFVGAMDYHANIEAAVSFAHQVWPQLHTAWPHLRLTLAGSNPAPAVRALTSIAGIEVTGTVPDLRPYYHQAAAAIVPLRTGGGTRLKILEALAAGVPVVSTPIGAEGLSLTPGEHILLAESPASWHTSLERILTEPDYARALAVAGRDVAARLYDWNVIGAGLWRIYQDLHKRGSS